MAVPRANQVDAVELDSECFHLLKGQYLRATAHLPGGIWDKIEPEISALLNVAVHVVPIFSNSSLVGHQLLGIQFQGSGAEHRLPSKWYLYGLLYVGATWFSERWKTISTLILPEASLPMADQVMDWVQLTLRILGLLNSLVFLKQGSYPTLAHRVLKLKTQLVNPNEPRSADMSTLTRELLWHSFAELLMFTLPLVNIHRLKRWLSSWKAKTETGPEGKTHQANALCPACDDYPIIPQQSECNHIFCYYCLKANLAADPHYRCPLCSNPAVL